MVFGCKAKDGTQFALKRILSPDRESTDAAREEIRTMKLLRGAEMNIVQLVAATETASSSGGAFLTFWMLMEVADMQVVDMMNKRRSVSVRLHEGGAE